MAEGENNKQNSEFSDERFKYIGFGVFPGKAGSIFKSEEEHKSILEKVRARISRGSGDVRDRCTLMEDRISRGERIFLTVVALVMLAALFLPWFSGYFEIVTTRIAESTSGGYGLEGNPLPEYEEVGTDGFNILVYTPHLDSASLWRIAKLYNPDNEGIAIVSFFDEKIEGSVEDYLQSEHFWAHYNFDENSGRETLELTGKGRDSWGEPLATSTHSLEIPEEDIETQPEDIDSPAHAAVSGGESEVSDSSMVADSGAVSELTEDDTAGMATVTEIEHDNRSVSGFSALLALGTYGSMIFTSGFVLVITGILLIIYFLCCIGIGILNLYILNGVKIKDPDKYALYLKKRLRLNWIPVYLWLGMFILSFFGASYGFNTEGMIEQVGSSYGIATFIGLSSFGIYLSLGAFLISALKGKEI